MKFFEIKQGKKWVMVQASSIKGINDFCEKNGISGWRMVGMMSRSETEIAKATARVVA